MGKLPRGLAYLAKLLDEPRTQANVSAFTRFQAYVNDRRGTNYGKPNALDRARANEYADARRGDLTRFVQETCRLDLPAAVWAVSLQIALRADVTPKSVREALILIGLESIADDLRQQQTVRPVSLPGAFAA